MEISEKHSLWIRWTHWINFPVLTAMIWSGMLIYWAHQAYPPFFPKGFFQVIDAEGNLAEGMALHFTLAWLFTLNGLGYVGYLILSGCWRDLTPNRTSLKNLIPVMLHEIGLKKNTPPQAGKFNPAQQLAYLSVTLMGFLSVLTGLVIYKPIQLHALTRLMGGYETARLIHFVLTLSYVGFFVIHVSQVIRAGWNNFRSMVSGFEVRKK